MAKLLLELGVKKGDRVFMLSAARDESFYTYMATAMVGGIWFGLNPRYTRDEFLYMVGRCQAQGRVRGAGITMH